MRKLGGTLVFGVLCACGGMLQAKDANGLSVIVKESVSEAGKEPTDVRGWEKGKHALALKVKVKNTSAKDLPAGTIAYIMLVKKWGTDDLVRHSGDEDLPALPAGNAVEQTVAKVISSGYSVPGNSYEFTDSIEAYQVIFSHGGKETIEVRKPSSFQKLNDKATDARKSKN